MASFSPIHWRDNHVELIDQRSLPQQETYVQCTTWEAVAEAIKTMVVRGAPAIGITAAYAVVLAAKMGAKTPEALAPVFAGLAATRPTAINLFWALERMQACLKAHPDNSAMALEAEALKIHAEDRTMCIKMGEHGAPLLPLNARVLTHCNAGALATGGHGTALGMIRSAHAQGRIAQVYADETRPFLQGARLTAWELDRDGIPTTVITDNMAGHFMQQGMIDAVIVGTDRIAANGDVANKIGTYTLAVLCQAHGVPFYVVGPTSTIDLECRSGAAIPIEQRPSREVTHVGSHQIVPTGVPVLNPAFDVTPAKLVTAIITEYGILHGEFGMGLRAHFERAQKGIQQAV